MTFTQNRLSTRLWALVAVALLAVGITVVGAESAAAKTGTSITMAQLSATSGSKVVMGKNKIKVSGTTSANLRGKTLKFQVSTNGGQKWTNVGATAVVKSDRSWSTSIKPPKAGKIMVRARWVGNSQLYGASAVRSIYASKQVTSVKFTSFVPANKERAVSGKKGTLKGVTSSNLKGKNVAILFQTKSGSWKKLGTTRVDANARFSYTFKVPSNGTVKFRVRYGGDSWRAKATADRTVTVWKWYSLLGQDYLESSGVYHYTDRPEAVQGVSYKRYLRTNFYNSTGETGYRTYNVKRQCVALNTLMAAADDNDDGFQMRLKVLADGNTKRTETMSALPATKKQTTTWFPKTTQQLRVEFENLTTDDGYGMWIEPQILCASSPDPR